MMTRFMFCFLLASGMIIPATAGGQTVGTKGKPELKWKAFNNGFAEARKDGKKLMLDVYTDWCGWCKKLDRDVYADERVSQYLTQRYVVVKLNAEDSTSVTYKDTAYSKISFARAFGVRGYPTIIFFDSNGEPINSLGGYVAADKFLRIVKFIGDDFYKSMSWDKYQETMDSQSSKEHQDKP